MKKITRTLMVFAVLLGVFSITSCGLFESVKEALSETYDTWYVYNNDGNRLVSINLDGPDESATDGVLSDAEVYVKFNDEDGLDVLICTTKEQTISYLGGTYNVSTTLTTGATKNYPPSATINSASWLFMIDSGKFEEEEPPKIDITLEQVLNGEFSLKRFLVQLLAAKLLEE